MYGSIGKGDNLKNKSVTVTIRVTEMPTWQISVYTIVKLTHKQYWWYSALKISLENIKEEDNVNVKSAGAINGVRDSLFYLSTSDCTGVIERSRMVKVNRGSAETGR